MDSLKSSKQKHIELEVNGRCYPLIVEGRTTLAEALRENLELTGTKIGCNRAECGSCTVLVDSRPVYSCSMLVLDAVGKKILTIEGLAEEGKLHPLQELFIEHDALQCGYCIPGIIMSLKALLDGDKLEVTRDDIRAGISGNICRCGAYPNIEKAAMEYAMNKVKTN